MSKERLTIELADLNKAWVNVGRERVSIDACNKEMSRVIALLAELASIDASADSDMEMYIRAELVEVIQEFFLRLTTSSVIMDIEGTPVSFGVISNLAWEIK